MGTHTRHTKQRLFLTTITATTITMVALITTTPLVILSIHVILSEAKDLHLSTS